MNNFWDSNIWSLLLLTAVLFLSMLFSHALKNKIPFLNKSLMPASVLGGIIILVFTTIYKLITKEAFFDLEMFSITTKDGNIMAGTSILEIITYHALAIGFIAMSLKSNKKYKAILKCTPKVRHFRRCIFNGKKGTKIQEVLAGIQTSRYTGYA